MLVCFIIYWYKDLKVDLQIINILCNSIILVCVHLVAIVCYVRERKYFGEKYNYDNIYNNLVVVMFIIYSYVCVYFSCYNSSTVVLV